MADSHSNHAPGDGDPTRDHVATAGVDRQGVRSRRQRAPPDNATGSTTADPVLAARGLRHTYADGTAALRGLSLSVRQGELFGLLGPNGAGKTTALRILTGRETPDAGRASVLGFDPGADPVAVRERVGIVDESAEPHSYQTVREYLRFVGRVRDLADDVVDRRIAEWADRLDFREVLDSLGADLSTGQGRKVAIAAAFLHEPRLVLADEPLANLDPVARRRVKEYFVEYVAAGNAVVCSTHEVAVAEDVCTRVGILDEGALAAVRGVDDDADLRSVFAGAIEESRQDPEPRTGSQASGRSSETG